MSPIRGNLLLLGSAVMAAALGSVACTVTTTAPECTPSAALLSRVAPQAPLALRSSPFDPAFASAAREFGVPEQLLRAVAWTETRWRMVRGTEEFPGRPPAYGVMALRGERLEQGASLAGVSVDAAEHDPTANIRAGAALLARAAATAGVDAARPDAWASVVAQYSGITLPAGRISYVEHVNALLETAVRMRVTGAPAATAQAACPATPGPDEASAVWRPSPNFDQRPSDSTGIPHIVIIHTCEGEYTGCWSWLVNQASQVSAHYVVNEDGSEISQLVREKDRAWHIAADYDCTLNHDHDCWLNGVQSNAFTVGVEHAGFVSQDSFPASQLDASAALVCDVTRRLNIPRDWQHIVGHGQLQPENRTDPGPSWPWVRYVHLVQAHCGELVVDDAAAYNDTTIAAATIPGIWSTSDSTPDYYGAGYRWASTATDASDAAVFAFHLAAAGTHVVDARWTGGTNRSPTAVYAVVTAAGDTLARLTVDQTASGGRWHALGTWSFPAGWNKVALLRRAPGGAVVVADAVRVR